MCQNISLAHKPACTQVPTCPCSIKPSMTQREKSKIRYGQAGEHFGASFPLKATPNFVPRHHPSIVNHQSSIINLQPPCSLNTFTEAWNRFESVVWYISYTCLTAPVVSVSLSPALAVSCPCSLV